MGNFYHGGHGEDTDIFLVKQRQRFNRQWTQINANGGRSKDTKNAKKAEKILAPDLIGPELLGQADELAEGLQADRLRHGVVRADPVAAAPLHNGDDTAHLFP